MAAKKTSGKKKVKRAGVAKLVGATVVGPAAGQINSVKKSLAERLDEVDAQGDQRAMGWQDTRSMLVYLGKRLGTITEKASVSPRPAPSLPDDEDDKLAAGVGDVSDDAIPPPFDFETLCRIHENSSALRQNIDALKTNVDGFGHMFVSVLDFDGPKIDEQVKNILIRQGIDQMDPPPEDLMSLTLEDFEKVTPPPEKVEETKTLWKQIAMVEKARAESFFEAINPLESFIEVRKKMRGTKELLGNAAWEVIREDPGDVQSKICQVYNVPFVNVRLVRSDEKPTTVDTKIRKDLISFETIEVDRYFRRYVRDTGNSKVFYKSFGDPRIISRETGNIYADMEAFREEEKEAGIASELYHWLIDPESGVYGIPRWIGALLSVLGSRAAEEVNFLYFDNKAMPPMVMLVSGGRLTSSSVERIESHIEDRIKGRENFHKIMVIEAVGQEHEDSQGDIEPSGKTRIELKPLVNEQTSDALFGDYDEANILKIGRAFRQPQILTGDSRDMNRSTAQSAKAMAEEQVYQPERDEFDACMDRHFLVNLGIHFWRFKSKAPIQRMPNDLVANTKRALESGGITPNEARRLYEDAFSTPFPYIDEAWADLPPKLAAVAAGFGGASGATSETTSGSPAAELVESVDGDLIARGRTEEGGTSPHQHQFVAIRTGQEIRFVVLPGGEDSHVHEVEPIKFSQGRQVEVSTSEFTPEEGGEGHDHEIRFTTPISKRRKQANAVALALSGMRGLIQEAIEEAKDDFFANREDDEGA